MATERTKRVALSTALQALQQHGYTQLVERVERNVRTFPVRVHVTLSIDLDEETARAWQADVTKPASSIVAAGLKTSRLTQQGPAGATSTAYELHEPPPKSKGDK